MSPTPTSVRQILLVEDNPGDARLIAEYLDEAGAAEFVLTTHTRLADTLAHLAARPCDVLLLDLGLPDSEGLQTLLAVREAQPDLPVVVLTGEYDEGLGTAAVAAGAQDFVVKGRVDARGLAAALRYAAERQRWMSELDHVNRLLRAIRGVNQLISRETEPQRILQGTCASLVEHRGYLAAWIVWLGADDAVRGLAGTGLEDHLDALRAELEQGRSPACVRLVREDGTTLATGESPQLCADCPLPAPVRDASSMVAPLSFGGATYGALSVSMPRHVPPTEEEQGLFAEVAGDVAYALHALEQQAGRARAEAARQASVSGASTATSRSCTTPSLGSTCSAVAKASLTGSRRWSTSS